MLWTTMRMFPCIIVAYKTSLTYLGIRCKALNYVNSNTIFSISGTCSAAGCFDQLPPHPPTCHSTHQRRSCAKLESHSLEQAHFKMQLYIPRGLWGGQWGVVKDRGTAKGRRWVIVGSLNSSDKARIHLKALHSPRLIQFTPLKHVNWQND